MLALASGGQAAPLLDIERKVGEEGWEEGYAGKDGRRNESRVAVLQCCGTHCGQPLPGAACDFSIRGCPTAPAPTCLPVRNRRSSQRAGGRIQTWLTWLKTLSQEKAPCTLQVRLMACWWLGSCAAG